MSDKPPMLSFFLILSTIIFSPTSFSKDLKEETRIVTLGGDISEITVLLGHQEAIVGRDSTSTFPTGLESLPNVGYVRSLSAEGILSLAPDIIIASSQAGPPEAIRQLQATGIKLEVLTDGHSVSALLQRISAVGKLLNEADLAAKLVKDITLKIKRLNKQLLSIKRKPTVLFILHRAGSSTLVAGRNTAADSLINLIGGKNVINASEGYKPVSAETLIANSPEIIILMKHSLDAIGGISSLRKHPIFKLTPAVQNERIITEDGLFMLGFGPRLPEAMSKLMEQIHPEFQE